MLRLSFADCGTISIHALREEGDTSRKKGVIIRILFLSTPSARRATCSFFFDGQIDVISIHALREEGDPYSTHALVFVHKFLSTPSARRATTKHAKCR